MRMGLLALLLWLVIGTVVALRGQEVHTMPVPCMPKWQLDEAILTKRIRLVMELRKAHRDKAVRVLVFRDTDGDYTVFEELESGMVCLLTIGTDMRLGPAFG